MYLLRRHECFYFLYLLTATPIDSEPGHFIELCPLSLLILCPHTGDGDRLVKVVDGNYSHAPVP